MQGSFKIATIVMGVTYGLLFYLNLFFMYVFDSEIVDAIIGISGALFLVIQQSVIDHDNLPVYRKMSELCKKY